MGFPTIQWQWLSFKMFGWVSIYQRMELIPWVPCRIPVDSFLIVLVHFQFIPWAHIFSTTKFNYLYTFSHNQTLTLVMINFYYIHCHSTPYRIRYPLWFIATNQTAPKYYCHILSMFSVKPIRGLAAHSVSSLGKGCRSASTITTLSAWRFRHAFRYPIPNRYGLLPIKFER